ncbi:23455_t:CDS:1, partial [Racocetra persica]
TSEKAYPRQNLTTVLNHSKTTAHGKTTARPLQNLAKDLFQTKLDKTNLITASFNHRIFTTAKL